MFNSLIFTFYIIILYISLNGYGLLFNKVCKLSYTDTPKKEFFGENCFFSIIILIPISILINFFLQLII